MARYDEGMIELTTRNANPDDPAAKLENVEWQTEPFSIFNTMPANKEPGFSSNFFPSYLDIFCKIELHEAHKEHTTGYVYDADITGFAFDEKQKPSTRYLVKGLNLYALHMRVVLMEFNSVGKHNLIGYNKKFDIPGELLTKGLPIYAKVPTSEDGSFTGYVFLEFDLLQEEEMLKVRVVGCTEIGYEPPESDCSCFEIKIGVFILSYVFVYALVMHLSQGGNDCGQPDYDDFRFCLWFVLVTFTSVGYGDMYPCTDEGRLLNTLFILLNQVTLAWFFSIAARLVLIQSSAFRVITNGCLSKLHLCGCNCELGDSPKFEQKDLVLCRDSDGDVRTAMVLHVHRKYDTEEDAYDYAYTLQWKEGAPDDIFVELEEDVRVLDPLTHARLWEELKITILQNTAFVFVCLLFGCLVFYETEKKLWDEGNAPDTLTHSNTLHFAIVTMSTVGYGDWAPATRIGRFIGAFYILLGVTVLGNFAGLAIEYIIKRDELVKSEDFLNNSLVTPTQLFEFDLNGDGVITKYEYLVKSLLACEFVTPDKIDLIMTKFHDIDKSKDGEISIEDFKQYNAGNSATPQDGDGGNPRNIAVEVVSNNRTH